MKKKKVILVNRVEQERQRQMLRLIKRYSSLILVPNTWILPYGYDFTYVDLATPGEQHQEFFCNTNNIIFAAMIFEAQMLKQSKVIVIISVLFKTVKL